MVVDYVYKLTEELKKVLLKKKVNYMPDNSDEEEEVKDETYLSEKELKEKIEKYINEIAVKEKDEKKEEKEEKGKGKERKV